MTVPGPSKRWFLLDGWDLGVSGFMGAFDPSPITETMDELESSFASAPIVQPAGYCDGGPVTVPFWADSTLQDLIDSLHGTTATTRKNNRIACYGWTATPILPAAGVAVKFEGISTYQASVTPLTPPKALTKFEVTLQPTGQVDIGDMLLNLSTKTTDGNTNGTYVDGGALSAPSTSGGVGYLQFNALTLDGATGLACEVTDSTDHVTFVTLVDFTDQTAARGAERKEVTGNVDRYIACSWDFTGVPGAGTTAGIFIGFRRY